MSKKVFLPISLDVWRSPIAGLLRAVVEGLPEYQFYSFSGAVTEEDRLQGERLWALPNLKKITPATAWYRRFDLVHTASLNKRNLAIARYCKCVGFARTKFLTTVNLEIDDSMPVEWAAYQQALEIADYFCAVSEVVGVNLKRDAPERLLRVIPNGFDPDFFDPAVYYNQDLPAQVKDLTKPFPLFVSALEPRKHPEFFIELAESLPDVTFVGAGWERPDTAGKFLDALKACPNIIWLGHVEQPQLRALLAKSSALIFPSEREGLPLTVIEAMGMGVPVCAQPKSSLPELLDSAPGCAMFTLEQKQDWVEFLQGLYADREKVQSTYVNSLREFVLKKYAWKAVGEAYRDLYEQILGESSR